MASNSRKFAPPLEKETRRAFRQIFHFFLADRVEMNRLMRFYAF